MSKILFAPFGIVGGILAAVLLGAEFNAEIERSRRIEAGNPADEEPSSILAGGRKRRQCRRQG